QPPRVRDTRDARATVVVLHRQVVVQMDVEIRRAAGAVEVEHAAGARGRRPELDRSRLDRDDRRLLDGHQIAALMWAARAKLAEVVDVGGWARDGEDEARHRALRRGSGRRPGEPEQKG